MPSLEKKKREATASWYYERSFLVHNLKSWHNSTAVTWDPEKKRHHGGISQYFPWCFHCWSIIPQHTWLLPNYFTGEATHPLPTAAHENVEALSYLRGFWRYGPSRLCHPERAVGLETSAAKCWKSYTSKMNPWVFKICWNRFTKSTCLPILRGH